jgi:hypothetical protein
MLDILQSLDVSMWNNQPLLSKICFAAAGAFLVLYIALVIAAGYSEEITKRHQNERGHKGRKADTRLLRESV